MEKLLKGLERCGLAMVCLCMFMGVCSYTRAADDATVGTLYEVTADTGVKEAADAGSA